MAKYNFVSVVIPFMETDSEKIGILNRLLDSLSGYDEIILVENWKQGYSVPINFGLSQATGDYMVILNDDLIQTQGSLKELCDKKAVTSPLVNYERQDFWGCCFCLPRWVYEKVGGMDEGYRISFYDDDSMWATLVKNNIPMKAVTSVNFDHPEGGRTLHTFPDWQGFSEENRERFISIWGYEPKVLHEFFDRFGRLPKKGELK